MQVTCNYLGNEKFAMKNKSQSKIKSCGHKLKVEDINSIFEKYRISKTRPKLEIAKMLSSASKPLSVAEIHHEVGGGKLCDISTVFRTIGQFKEKGLVKEIGLAEGFFRYEFLASGKDVGHHHHHVRCRTCGLIKALPFCELEIFEKMITKLGFTSMIHHLEFTGLCEKCS
jgi:Fur family zinc uptake transcriptional regulator